MISVIKKGAVLTIALFLCLPSIVSAEGRFSAPNVNAAADGFSQKPKEMNSSYLIARFNAKSKQATRKGLNPADAVGQITNSANGTSNGTNILQSVVVLPGVNVDEIVIINQNQGDGFIINR